MDESMRTQDLGRGGWAWEKPRNAEHDQFGRINSILFVNNAAEPGKNVVCAIQRCQASVKKNWIFTGNSGYFSFIFFKEFSLPNYLEIHKECS